MTNENQEWEMEITSKIQQPDTSIPEHSNPAWKFYLTWHTCQYSKALVDKALSIMSQEKFPNAELYQEARDLILDASRFLAEQGHLM